MDGIAVVEGQLNVFDRRHLFRYGPLREAWNFIGERHPHIPQLFENLLLCRIGGEVHKAFALSRTLNSPDLRDITSPPGEARSLIRSLSAN
jgi:hypothetical protein